VPVCAREPPARSRRWTFKSSFHWLILQPEWLLPPDQHRHYALHFPIAADAAAAGVDIDGVLRDGAAADIGGL
jgi:hypothetical protein